MSKSDKQPTEPFTPSRGKLEIQRGLQVIHNNSAYVVTEVISITQVIAKSLDTEKAIPLHIDNLEVVQNEDLSSLAARDMFALHSAEYERAKERFAIIEPLLEFDHISKKDIEKRAQETDASVPSIYRWLKRFRATGVISSLMMKQRGWSSNRSRLPPRVDEIVNDVIEKVYLSKRRKSVMKVIQEIEIQCAKLNLPAPHPNTVRGRISNIDERIKVRRRGNRDQARNLYDPAAGTFPNADYPLAVIQIDHTPMDIIIVDDENRQPLGRPFLTLAIDVFSRCVTGYYIGLEAPNETSVAMCISHSILPKEGWLELFGVSATWDVRGFPAKIHVDNGADFRTETLRRACREYQIQLEYRPVKQPQYGGHIERLLGTFMRKLHDIDGTTFESVYKRKNYDSDKHASMTMNELELWLLKYITQIYHTSKHTGIGVSPNKKWELGIWGDGVNKGTGLPAIPTDPMTVQLDFMPLFQRTVQKDGVNIEGVQYYEDVLRAHIGARDETTNRARKFIFRRDPRNISVIWFFDESLNQYFEIPFADRTLPRMSLWQLRAIKKHLDSQGRDKSNHHEIRSAYEELEQIEQEARRKTRGARRKAQREKNFQIRPTPADVVTNNVTPMQEQGLNTGAPQKDSGIPDDEYFDLIKDIRAFDED
ncbi:MAG: transposase [Idiomarinaceae bacterium HL-53]|nr:MAG: transposase [Idiomarinaceae bacterium HL-53]CUS47638.1 putative transposase [Idiomarinaceae bacterium HL-53]